VLENLSMYAPAAGAIALLFAFYLAGKVNKADPGNEKMIEISGHIHEGAMAFLRRQYTALAVFVLFIFLVLGLVFHVVLYDASGYGIFFIVISKLQQKAFR
jgi:K(+)-stimulated pyrophosphate-energized sodium pump